MNMDAILTRIRETKPPITVIGETIKDHWYFGRSLEPSQENASVGKFVAEKKLTMAGGAANVRFNLTTATRASSHHLTSYFITAKHRWWDTDSQCMQFRYDEDATETDSFWLNRLKECRENVVISDYGKGMFTWDLLEQASHLLGSHKVIFSPHLTNRTRMPDRFTDALGSWVWVMNYEEACASASLPPIHVITHGAKDVHFVDGIVPVSQVKKPLHTIGIGDVFLACFAAAYFVEIPMQGSIEYAVQVCRNVLKLRRPGTCCIQEKYPG